MRYTLPAAILFALSVGIFNARAQEEKEKIRYDKEEFSSFEEYLRYKSNLRQRLGKIIIPKVDFEEVEVSKVIDYLRQKTREIDNNGQGFNVFYRCSKEARNQKITIELDNVPVQELLRFVCLAAKIPINFKIEKYAVVVYDRGPKEEVNSY